VEEALRLAGWTPRCYARWHAPSGHGEEERSSVSVGEMMAPSVIALSRAKS
jgi:hypothetical protein